MKQPEESINHLKENEAAKTGNNDNAENVKSLQQTLRETGRILVNDFSEEEIEYICMKESVGKLFDKIYLYENYTKKNSCIFSKAPSGIQ